MPLQSLYRIETKYDIYGPKIMTTIEGLYMQIVDIDNDPNLSTLNKGTEHIFAGHINEIVGVDYITPTESKNGRKYHGRELIDNASNVKTIWINHSKNNKEFSIKIGNLEVIKQFIQDYESVITGSNSNSYFVVVNDMVYRSRNPQYDYKTFFPIDDIKQLREEFKIWRA